MEKNNIFFIGSNTPSSKNGRVWTGKYFIASEATQYWRKITEHQWLMQKDRFLAVTKDLPKPLHIQFIYVRKSRHKYDFINLCQTIQDEMKVHGWIEDDNVEFLKPYPGDDSYNKLHAGCFIKVLTSKPNL